MGTGGRLPPRARDRLNVRYVARVVGRALTWLRAKTPATPPRAANVRGANSRLPHRLAGGDVLGLVRRPRTCSKAEGARVLRGAGVGRTPPTGPQPGVLEPRKQRPRRPESGRAAPGHPAGRARRRKPANGRLAVPRRGTSADEQHHRKRDPHARRPACWHNYCGGCGCRFAGCSASSNERSPRRRLAAS
jgi:hypothetical protein